MAVDQDWRPTLWFDRHSWFDDLHPPPGRQSSIFRTFWGLRAVRFMYAVHFGQGLPCWPSGGWKNLLLCDNEGQEKTRISPLAMSQYTPHAQKVIEKNYRKKLPKNWTSVTTTSAAGPSHTERWSFGLRYPCVAPSPLLSVWGLEKIIAVRQGGKDAHQSRGGVETVGGRAFGDEIFKAHAGEKERSAL